MKHPNSIFSTVCNSKVVFSRYNYDVFNNEYCTVSLIDDVVLDDVFGVMLVAKRSIIERIQ